MALLYETVLAFENTWIECLGDLGRYRMAIEDDDVRDSEVWTTVARYGAMQLQINLLCAADCIIIWPSLPDQTHSSNYSSIQNPSVSQYLSREPANLFSHSSIRF